MITMNSKYNLYIIIIIIIIIIINKFNIYIIIIIIIIIDHIRSKWPFDPKAGAPFHASSIHVRWKSKKTHKSDQETTK